MDYVNNCPISQVVYSPEQESVSFSGFAWSNAQGIIHEAPIDKNKEPKKWLGTQQ